MAITSVQIRHLRLPLVRPFQTSFQRETAKDTLVVAVQAGGATGWGEAPVHLAPRFSGESIDTAWVTIRDWLAPPLIGHRVHDPATPADRWVRLRGNPIARSGVEQALWDLHAQRSGRSLAQVYAPADLPPAATIGVGVSVGIQPDLGRLLDRVREHVAAGYQRVKIKIEPGWDVEPCERLRAEFADLALGADANGAYDPDDLAELRPLDRLGLAFLEQPLAPDRLVAHARWQAELTTPICLDESLDSPARVDEALALDACRMVNIKIGRIGGPGAARRARDLCRARGVPCWVGGMLESGVGRLHNVAMAASAGFTHPGDISASSRYVDDDIIDPPVTVSRAGDVAVPDGPGLGAAIRHDVLERYTVRTLRIG